jgi:hypothetical protein
MAPVVSTLVSRRLVFHILFAKKDLVSQAKGQEKSTLWLTDGNSNTFSETEQQESK